MEVKRIGAEREGGSYSRFRHFDAIFAIGRGTNFLFVILLNSASSDSVLPILLLRMIIQVIRGIVFDIVDLVIDVC